jgi:hypothetical protein
VTALWICLGIITAGLLLLLVPVKVSFVIDTSATQRFRLRVSWLFGLLRRDANGKDGRGTAEHGTPKGKKRLKKEAAFPVGETVQSVRPIVPQIVKLIKTTFRRIKKDIRGTVIIGFAEPDYTGMLFAVAGSLNAILNTLPGYDGGLIPAFDGDDTFEGDLKGQVRIVPLLMVGPALRFGFSRETIGVVWKMVKS